MRQDKGMLRRWAAGWACALLLVLAGCSSVRPWINPPLQAGMGPALPEIQADVAGRGRESFEFAGLVTLSGGGARAAAFAYGVLRELKATGFQWNGRPTTLADEIDFISGVSGGSIAAAYYAAFGDAMFTRFEPDYLLTDFQTNLVHQIFWPRNLYRLGSPWYGRSHVLAERLDELFVGKTFGDVRQRPNAPRLLINATDLTLGSAFPFSPQQFSLICSDLDRVPLSFAVASSSAVPILLTPMTLKNHASDCPQPPLQQPGMGGDNYRARLMAGDQRSYLDGRRRAYIHLVDGGLSDNLGVRGLLDQAMASGGLSKMSRGIPPGTVRKLVLIAVNSERDPAERIEQSNEVPGSLQVMDALVFGAGARATQETLAMMEESAQRWAQEVLESAGQDGSPFAKGAEIYVIPVNLRDAPERRTGLVPLLQIPTAFSLPKSDVRRLERAGRDALRASPRFQQLKAALQAEAAAEATLDAATETTAEVAPEDGEGPPAAE